jgi:hypothetical protein
MIFVDCLFLFSLWVVTCVYLCSNLRCTFVDFEVFQFEYSFLVPPQHLLVIENVKSKKVLHASIN